MLFGREKPSAMDPVTRMAGKPFWFPEAEGRSENKKQKDNFRQFYVTRLLAHLNYDSLLCAYWFE